MKKHLLLFFFTFFTIALYSQEIILPEVVTYINNENPAVEQRKVFTKEEIEELNLVDLPSLLQSAGIQLLSYGPYGLEQKPSIRGFTDETVRVIIDGVCVNNSQYGTFDFSTLNPKDIEKLEIVRGGFTESVTDEDAVAGAIYITTKKQEFGTQFASDSYTKTYFNKEMPFDTFGQFLGFNTNLGKTYLKLNNSINYAGNKYLYKNYNGNVVPRINAEVLDNNANLNVLRYFNNGSSLGLTDIFYIGNKNTPGSDSAKNTGNLKDLDNNISLQYINPEVLKAFKVESNLTWLSNNRLYDDNSGHSEHYVNSLRYNFTQDVYNYRLFKQSTGINFDYTNLNSTNDGQHNQFSGAFKSTSKIYLPNQWIFSLPIAVKFCGQNFAFTPKFGTGVELSKVDLFWDIYKMTQFPNMDDLYWEGAGYHGNPDLIPETGYGTDFHINLKNQIFPLELSVFSNYYMNKIQWAGNSPQNVASAFYFGSDFNLEKSLIDNKLNLNLSGEYLYTRLLDKSNQLTYGKKIMYTPDFVSSLTLSYKPIPTTSIVFNANYMGKRYKSNLNKAYMKPYLLVNLSAQTDINVNTKAKNWTISPYLKGENLLNWRYESIPDYPMPGISLTAGVKVSL